MPWWRWRVCALVTGRAVQQSMPLVPPTITRRRPPLQRRYKHVQTTCSRPSRQSIFLILNQGKEQKMSKMPCSSMFSPDIKSVLCCTQSALNVVSDWEAFEDSSSSGGGSPGGPGGQGSFLSNRFCTSLVRTQNLIIRNVSHRQPALAAGKRFGAGCFGVSPGSLARHNMSM